MAEFYQGMVDAANSGNKEAIQESTSRETYENHVAVSYLDESYRNIMSPNFDNLNVDQQHNFLQNYYERFNSIEGKVKGLAAKNLRDNIRNKAKFDLDGLFKANESFMNNELRDFLNLNIDGTMNYDIHDLKKKGSGWKEMSSLLSQYHQTNAGMLLNAKFVHEDGREVIVKHDGTVITKFNKEGNFDIDYGTFNYASDAVNHCKYDMNPFEAQYSGQYIKKNYFGSLIEALIPNSAFWNDSFVIVQTW